MGPGSVRIPVPWRRRPFQACPGVTEWPLAQGRVLRTSRSYSAGRQDVPKDARALQAHAQRSQAERGTSPSLRGTHKFPTPVYAFCWHLGLVFQPECGELVGWGRAYFIFLFLRITKGMHLLIRFRPALSSLSQHACDRGIKIAARNQLQYRRENAGYHGQGCTLL
jgi:hypothetical protein